VTRIALVRPPSLAVLLVSLVCAALAAPAAADPHPFTVHDLLAMERLSDHQVSPDGRRVAFVVRTTDLEADRGQTDLWLLDLDAAGRAAGEPRRLTTARAGESSPRWSPDGRSLYFLSRRSGSSQVWRLPLAGGEAVQVTDLPLDVGNLLVAPDGRRLAFSHEVFVDCDTLACTADRLAEREAAKPSGQVIDQLLYRHWDTWRDGRRSHLFTLALDEAGAAAGEPVDVSRGLVADVPSMPFGGVEEIAFSPDGRRLVFAARDAGREEAWSTNFDLFSVAADGSGERVNLTAANAAWDSSPVFSPDGRTLAYLAMERPGYEADRWGIRLRDVASGTTRALADDWDRSPGGLVFSPDGATLWATAPNVGQTSLFTIDVASGAVREVVREGHVRGPAIAAAGSGGAGSSGSAGGYRVVFGLDTLTSPVDLYSVAADGSDVARLTEINRERVAAVRFGEAEQFSFAGANGDTVYAWLVKPVDFRAGRKYPLAFLIHGGPQGSFGNDFHYRWNPQTYAGAGYAALMIDFHGSVGYGQDFTDAIRGDWGGAPLEDLQKGLAAALERYPWIDGDRACALGASYGGYMVNWIAGRWPDRFDCLVNHDGLFDNRMMYYTTEELWFVEWEHGGPYFENPEGHERHNPANHVAEWRTPMLVIQGGLDFRVPETQSFATFTALQRRGVPSKLLYFPDENHWVLKPSNSVLWHETVLGWLDRWAKGEE
jgi:dipeptidyl aminopeptidase/acylaminoacyl peptidase